MNIFETPIARAYRRMAKTADGQRVFADLMRFGHLFEDCFAPGDPLSCAYREGQRRVALRILSFTSMTPERAQALAEQSRKDDYGQH